MTATQLGVLMDPINAISYKKDSTLAMLLAAQHRGWQLVYMEQPDLYLCDGVAMASMRPLQVFADPVRWFKLGDPYEQALSSLPIILRCRSRCRKF